jgi:4-amino-4-deoxy-L-arabinose transferase-like glycosyltransferase
MQARRLVLAMTVFQAAWLAAIWYSGTARHWEKLPGLLVYSIACGAVLFFLPTAWQERLERLETAWLGREPLLLRRFLWVLLAGIGCYAWLQLGWPDEKAIFAAARTIPEAGLAALFERYSDMPWLGDQHPPLVPLVYGLAMSLFGVHVLVPRLVSLLLALGVLAVTYAIAARLYNRRIALRAAVFLFSAPFFFRTGATALSDMPMAFCFVLGLWLFLRILERPSYRRAAGAGVCIGAGLLCRYPMVFIFPLLGGWALLQRRFFRTLPHLALLTLVSGAMLAVWLAFAYHAGIIGAQAEKLSSHAGFAVQSASFGYWRWYLVSVCLRMPSGLGVWNFPLLGLGLWMLIRRRSRADLGTWLWIAAVFLPLLATLPGPRFFLPAFPALAIAMAWGAERLDNGRARVVLLSLLYAVGAMVLFVDWFQAAGNLIRH